MNEWLPLAGVVVAQFGLVWVFWLKQGADDARRWHERRLDVYVRFLRHVDLLLRNLPDETTGWRSDEEREAGESVWLRLLPELNEASFEVELLATPKVIAAAYELNWVIGDATRFTQNAPTGEASETWFSRERVREKREVFESAVRSELGISAPSRVIARR